MSYFKKAKKFIGIAIFRGAGALSILGLYFIISKNYPPQQASTFYFVLTMATVAAQVLVFGYNSFSVKRISSGTISPDQLIPAISRLLLKRGLVFCALGLTVFFATHNYFGVPTTAALSIVSLCVLVPAIALIGSFFQAVRSYNTAIYLTNISNNFLLAIMIFGRRLLFPGLHQSGDDVHVLLFAAACLTSLLAVLLLRRSFSLDWAVWRRAPMIFSREDHRETYRLWAVLGLIYVSASIPLVGYYLTGAKADYAYFSVSERLANAVNFFSVISNFFLTPIIPEKFFSGQIDELRIQFIRITRLVTLACLPIALLMIFIPSTVLKWFGHSYIAGSTYLVIMVLGQLFNVATGSVNSILNMAGFERDLIHSIWIGAALQITCMALLGPMLGGIAFALAYTLNIVCQNGLAALAVRRHVGINVLDVIKIGKTRR